ncbi:hypothetical protein BJF97_02495 [Klebsiella sp. LTGPAF-6F]|nr:hypothetical protein BJF97_02495 [Klebsiella sp. LTGPAF-6F]
MFIKHVDIILISAAVGAHFALEQFQRLKKRLQEIYFRHTETQYLQIKKLKFLFYFSPTLNYNKLREIYIFKIVINLFKRTTSKGSAI